MVGVDKSKKSCLFGGETYHKDELLRFVHGPDGLVWFDPSGKADGESVYLRPQRALFDEAVSSDLMAQQLNAVVRDNLGEQVKQGLENKLCQTLGLARKAGHTLLGVESVKDFLKTHTSAVILVAKDAGVDGKRLMESCKEMPDVQCLQVATKALLSQGLGVKTCAVVGITGHSALSVLKAVKKYRLFMA